MNARRKFHDFGSVSTGTMRPADLIPDFAWELGNACGRITREHRSLVAEANRLKDYDSEEAGYVLDALFDALNCYAPPYAYFGAHPGDGADYGFWLAYDFDNDFDGLKVADTGFVPKGYSGEVLHVNDHGNMTLYAYTRGRGREVWALV